MVPPKLSWSNEFEVRPIRPQNKVEKLSDKIAELRSGLEATKTKVDKSIPLLNKQVIARPQSPTWKTDNN